ncbi:M6 metalloprotease [Paraphaeosphaeria sporulosa]|uniref:M6 metalloprotease n=1 Tax=Paraphaeosphaeria sporulosa TaxID=1460663 RepID=A0A177C541_9PLEO|nr:M6 metalloprotease [Paraphaeosphaeria sporulosa]OAG02556.1 M6 metalloprotease [Paraphaeosphaeria sporulosa]
MRSLSYSSVMGCAMLHGAFTYAATPDTSSSCEAVTVTETVTATGDPVPTTSPPTPSPAPCRPSWDSTAKAPSTGRLRAGLIFVDFSDTPASASGQTPSELFEPLREQPADLYRDMSFGNLEFEIVPLLDTFYRMPNISAAYGFADDEGLTAEEHGRYIADALAIVGDAFDFASVDVLFIAPPKDTDEINRSAQYNSPVTAPGGREFAAGTVITFGTDLYPEGAWKTINHETGHAMGLPDLYPYGAGGNGLWVGGFDMMGIVWGQSPDLFAWHKWHLNWIEESQVDCVTEAGTSIHQLAPIEVEGGVKAVAIPVNATGYVMAEVRSTQGIDHAACEAATGVLLYTADAAVGSGDGPVRVIDANPGSEGCDSEANGAVLNDAPLRGVGATFDTEMGVKVTILSQSGDDYIIQVEREVLP